MTMYAFLSVVLASASLLGGLRIWWVRARRARAKSAIVRVPPHAEFVFTRHARQRMAERHVSQAAISSTLTAPDRCLRDEAERSYKFERDFDNETVKVWVSDEQWPPVDKVVIKSTAASRFAHLEIPAVVVGRVIGRKGGTIQRIRATSGARVSIEDNGHVVIRADSQASVTQACALVTEAASGARRCRAAVRGM